MTHHPLIIEARSWVGTPFKHQGRCRAYGHHRGGVDCLGLVLQCAEACNLRLYDAANGQAMNAVELDDVHYGHRPDVHALHASIARYMKPAKQLQDGALALFNIDGRAQHMGLVCEYGAADFGVIHAYAPMRKVVEHRLSTDWLHKVHSLWVL